MADEFTTAARLCDNGTVRGGPMHHGTDYPCTGHAHFAGEHIRCTSPAHAPPGFATFDEAARLGKPLILGPGRTIVAPGVESWTCPHGTTYTGSADFLSGARSAHDEIAMREHAQREREAPTN